MNWQELAVYLIVGAAAIYLSLPLVKKYIFPIIANIALKKGKVKWAMKLRAISKKKDHNRSDF